MCVVQGDSLECGPAGCLTAGRVSLAQLRRGVRAFLQHAPPSRRDDAVLVVTELVTNALEHGVPPVSLRLLRFDGGARLRAEVTDAAPPMPRPRPATTPGGYGLRLVDTLCSSWSITPAPTRAGKTVRAEMTLRG